MEEEEKRGSVMGRRRPSRRPRKVNRAWALRPRRRLDIDFRKHPPNRQPSPTYLGPFHTFEIKQIIFTDQGRSKTLDKITLLSKIVKEKKNVPAAPPWAHLLVIQPLSTHGEFLLALCCIPID